MIFFFFFFLTDNNKKRLLFQIRLLILYDYYFKILLLQRQVKKKKKIRAQLLAFVLDDCLWVITVQKSKVPSSNNCFTQFVQVKTKAGKMHRIARNYLFTKYKKASFFAGLLFITIV